MKTEMKMKNLALVELLDAAGSSALAGLYQLMPGGTWDKQKRKLEVMHACNEALLSCYKHRNQIVCHYYDSPGGTVPVWALMEIITLGHFGALLREVSDQIRSAIAGRWGLERGNGGLVPHVVLTVTSLRNCVAHNGTVFDTRFATAAVRADIGQLVARELSYGGIIDFGSITDYFLLLSYLTRRLGAPKREAYPFIRQYRGVIDGLRNGVSTRVFDMIVHTDNRAKVNHLEAWLRST
jgi:abortive infection bacteriophage resistance protein